MNAKLLVILFTIIALTLSGCAAATPKLVAQSPTGAESVEVEKEVVVEKQVVQATAPRYANPTAAPAAEMATPGTVPTPVDNFFQDYGVNPFEDPLEDHLSTFSLDVDTASYAVARKYIQEGNLPPADAVRAEEFVNYFNAGYPTPQDVAFGVYADGAPSPFHHDGSYLLRIGIQGYQVPEYARKPSSLTFVIDVSGSMGQDNRLELVKRSLDLLVERLRPDDVVSIVVYGTDARIVLYPTSGRDSSRILSAIYSLQPEGSTNAEAGLKLGYEIAMQAYRPEAINRVILCSDGVANVGATGPDEILRQVHGYVEEGITLTTVGFGMGNFNDVLLEQLADNGNGNYAYVDDIDEAKRLFVENLTATLQVIALDAKVQVDFNADVVSRYRLIGYENRAVADQDFRNDSVDAGEIGAGHSATALYAVQFKDGAEGRIATVQLRWQDPDTRQVREINGNINTFDMVGSFEQASSRYRLAVLVAQYAELLRQSPWARDTRMVQLLGYASQIASELPEDADVAEFAQLVTRASQIEFFK